MSWNVIWENSRNKFADMFLKVWVVSGIVFYLCHQGFSPTLRIAFFVSHKFLPHLTDTHSSNVWMCALDSHWLNAFACQMDGGLGAWVQKAQWTQSRGLWGGSRRTSKICLANIRLKNINLWDFHWHLTAWHVSFSLLLNVVDEKKLAKVVRSQFFLYSNFFLIRNTFYWHNSVSFELVLKLLFVYLA